MPSRRIERRTAIAWAIAAVFALALGARWTRWAVAAKLSPTGTAEWIWSGDGRKELGPTAFWAARDFELPALPASARLLVQADPEYVLWLNGRRIGSGTFHKGDPLDLYEVAPFLEPGRNRILAELRSDHGTGGFLASLVDGATGRRLLATDSRWQILRRDDPGLLRGLRSLDGGTPAYSWSYPPLGRWGMPRPGPVRRPPLLEARPVPAGEPQRSGSETRFTWDRAVSGRLALEVVASEAPQVALVYWSAGSSGPESPPAPVIIMPNGSEWIDARSRRFGAVRIVGTLRTVGARALPDDRVAPADPPVRGVLGIEPPPLRTPVEDEVRRQLERLPGL
ncbi:MAG TPA: hypothetical protein VN783_06720 [Thermoanaerobaculia bacterium]|nr:hypothetical protein [Thermoanaerobaculia bacterium]